MEDNPASGGFPNNMGNLQETKGTYGKKRGMQTVPDNEESGEDQ
eukprot:CAMPEP_0201587062 /NCGR_PEP_ID=MMETSP0190_2-20130828/139372_1 /ASSEMBLY_ACC=CAM_ASM_000263 /TAXON_ID=37353 /ORGANISM="Rosalina sp." /LENGTH=43 /DNA_ID= /DNA_START= /DNA_END= /DNA_ORIENTATION=